MSGWMIPEWTPPSVRVWVHGVKVVRYHRSRKAWKHIHLAKDDDDSDQQDFEPPSSLKIVTWNVDFMGSYTFKRMEAALEHIREDVIEHNRRGIPEPCCIFLQEVHATAFPALLQDDWVQTHFFVTPSSPEKWPEPHVYGNVSLIERSLLVKSAEMLELPSKQGRTAIILDLKMKSPGGRDVVVRLINTHTESTDEPGCTDMRAHQLYLCAKYARDATIEGGIVAGDLNAITPREQKDLAQAVRLRDAWWREHPDEIEEGYTWGFQGKGPDGKEQYPPGRLDKVLYTGQRGFRVEEPQRIGVGEQISSGEWISDHYGLVTNMHLLR